MVTGALNSLARDFSKGVDSLLKRGRASTALLAAAAAAVVAAYKEISVEFDTSKVTDFFALKLAPVALVFRADVELHACAGAIRCSYRRSRCGSRWNRCCCCRWVRYGRRAKCFWERRSDSRHVAS